MQHLGFNLLYLVPGQVGGTEVYAKRLVGAIAEARPDLRVTAFCGREAAPVLRRAGWPANVAVHELPVRCTRKPARALAEQTLLPAAAARAGVDLLHSLGTTTPFVTSMTRVVTVHDLIYEHFPATFPAPLRVGLRALVGPGARRADRVLTGSEWTKTDVAARLGIPPDRIDAVPHGFGQRRSAAVTSEAELRERYGLGAARVVLCVSAALEHKNLDRLVDAMDGVDARLVIVGHAGREGERLARRAVFTGWIPSQDLEGLYALAACCAYPSLHEGFGLPVLEAMVREVPLACSDATALPEVAGDAVEYFDPLSTPAIAAAVTRLLDDRARAQELVERGRQRWPQFTWERAARGVLASYDRALASRQ